MAGLAGGSSSFRTWSRRSTTRKRLGVPPVSVALVAGRGLADGKASFVSCRIGLKRRRADCQG
jgi:hypothetical protein